jgi:hypothetical protein
MNTVEQGMAEGAPELLKKEMPLLRHAEKLLAQNGVSKDDPDYHHHLGNTIKYLRQFGNIDLINKQGVAEGSEEKHDFIPVKLLKRNVPYWLTYDFYGYGGKLVKLSGPDPTNNNFIIVKDQDGNEYSVSKKAVLFASDPNQNKGREQGVTEGDRWN